MLRALGLLHWGSLPLEPGMTVYLFFFTDSIPMKMLFCNCQGSNEFLKKWRDLVNGNDPMIVVLIETRTQSRRA